jgi:UDP-perosamine 4-acetyltransferase
VSAERPAGTARLPLIIVGAGGHAKVVIATARALGFTDLAVVDDDETLWGRSLFGVSIGGPTGDVLAVNDELVVLAIGSNAVRARLGRAACCRFVTLVHPSAIVDPSAIIGPGSVVFAGAVIQPDARLGAHVIVTTAASIDHDCVLGDAVHVAPGARLAGNVTLGDEVLVGIGAVVTPGIVIGARAIVGAGAAVVHDQPADAIVVGVPARPRM